MPNLLRETQKILAKNGLCLEDIVFISTSSGDFYPSNGGRIFLNVEYNNGFGGQEIDPALKIVGRNWWLERQEYDGYEGWEFKRLPTFGNHTRRRVTPFG